MNKNLAFLLNVNSINFMIKDINEDHEQEMFQINLKRLSHGIVIPLIIQHLKSSGEVLENDLHLWIIQRSLVLTDVIYAHYLVENIVS